MPGHRIRIFVTPAAIAAVSLLPATAFAQAPAPARPPAARTAAPRPPSKPMPRLADGKPNLGLTPNSRGHWEGGDGPLVQGANFPLKDIPFQPWAKALYDYRNQTLAKDDPDAFVSSERCRFRRRADSRSSRCRSPRIYILRRRSAWRTSSWRPFPFSAATIQSLDMGFSDGHWESDTLVVDRPASMKGMAARPRRCRPPKRSALPSDSPVRLRRTLRVRADDQRPGAYTRPWSGGWNFAG
jgi:hypothetical protein